MKTALLVAPFSLILMACGPSEISLDRFNELSDQYCSCLNKLETMNGYETACHKEDESVNAEEKQILEKIKALREEDPEFAKEQEKKFRDVLVDHLDCTLEALKQLSEKDMERMRIEEQTLRNGY